MPTLSVILISRNEAANIEACLESVRFADQWIVVDSGSTDDTVEKARRWGAEVYIHEDWPGFGQQKNRALGYAKGDWVLSVDSDERVTPELAAEIERVVATPSYAGYTMPRLSFYCGRFLRHGGWWPDRVLRLFRRKSGSFSNRIVHEKVLVDGSVGKLRNYLLHYSYHTLESVLDKMNVYSTAGAQGMLQGNRRGSFLQAVSHGLWTFLRGYVFRAGFLDGRQGFMAAFSNAEGTYYRYVKRWLMDRQSNSSEEDSENDES